MNGYFSNAFAFSPSSPSSSRAYSSSEAECLHVGSGIQSFRPLIDTPDECCKSACSSMCSAASTVASALYSIEGSVSFLSSSEITFDLARHVTLRLNEQQEPRNRRRESERGWRRCADRSAPSERRPLDSFGGTCQAEPISSLEFTVSRSGISSAPRQEQPPVLEEFSLGSGNPYAPCNFSVAARNQ
uniref:Uncharacterized protein n=1 Tax=Cryptomonas curvata TaxID=233186 RepID=A0A7S0MBK0_9CRYP